MDNRDNLSITKEDAEKVVEVIKEVDTKIDSLTQVEGHQFSEEDQKALAYLTRNRKSRRGYFKEINAARVIKTKTRIKNSRKKKINITVSKETKLNWRDHAPKFTKEKSEEMSFNIGFIKGWRNPEKVVYEH